MSGNTIGKLFTVTSFGESHGPALGCIVDGCPPGLELSVEDMQHDLDRRKPGQSRLPLSVKKAMKSKYFQVFLRVKLQARLLAY